MHFPVRISLVQFQALIFEVLSIFFEILHETLQITVKQNSARDFRKIVGWFIFERKRVIAVCEKVTNIQNN